MTLVFDKQGSVAQQFGHRLWVALCNDWISSFSVQGMGRARGGSERFETLVWYRCICGFCSASILAARALRT
jgi:hypothetical protein